MGLFLLVTIKLLIGFLAMVIIINISGKGNLAPSSTSDQIINYVFGGRQAGITAMNCIPLNRNSPVSVSRHGLAGFDGSKKPPSALRSNCRIEQPIRLS